MPVSMIVWCHHEGDEVHEVPLSSTNPRESLTHYLQKVNSSQGGYVDIFDDKGKMLYAHPMNRQKGLVLF